MKVVEEFYGELYHSDVHPQNEIRKDIKEILAVTKGEIRNTENMKTGKAADLDGISVALIKAAGEIAVENYNKSLLNVLSKEKFREFGKVLLQS